MPKLDTKLRKVLRIYKLATIAVSAIGIGYLLLLCFPNPLFAHSTAHENYNVYSREPIDSNLAAVLDSAEARLKRSPINDSSIQRNVYLTNGFGMYTLLSHKARNSFANNTPYIENIIVNKTDIATDRVTMNREKNNSRSLSGVIAHEVTHILIQRRYGTMNAIVFVPTWKKEGYCEYIAGDSTITLQEGVRLWRENPADDTGYRYIKFHLMVKHLLENENVSVDDLFRNEFDEAEVAARTFASLANTSDTSE